MDLMVGYLLITLIALPAFAQSVENPNSLSIGIGGAAPAGAYGPLDPGLALELNYGYRYTPYIQVDLGFESSWNRDYRDFLLGGPVRTTAFFLAPVGGRLNIPLRNERIVPFVGLGGVYNFDGAADIVPGVDAHKGGAYGLAGLSYALDSDRRHRVGVSVRYINIMSAGEPHPQWVNVFGEYTYSWGR
jgi:hypothetical protein